MQSAPEHPLEKQRLKRLDYYEVMDSDAEKTFDELTELASAICGTPISLISLVDAERQWFKSKVGLDAEQTPKSIAFCSHALLQNDVFEISNALEDQRFFDNPLVTGAPDIRFYAGAPLIAPDGSPIGTLCVIDREPKKLDSNQLKALTILSHQVISQLELRKHSLELKRSNKQQQNMLSSIGHDLRSPFNGILGLAQQLNQGAGQMSQERIVKSSHMILDSSLRVYQLLDEMLQWATQRVGRSGIIVQEHSLKALLNNSYDLLHEALQLKSIEFQNDVGEYNVLVDETLSKAVIRNLLNNAIKFCPEQGQIQVSAYKKDSSVVLQVFNSGEHISEEKQQQLFNSPVDSALGTAGEGGTGLGLNLCKEFIEQQGGEIWLERSNEQGNYFCVSFQCA
ncbi:GAF domain-containing sensor histidine kinase [Agaribacterium haliotis]|uniref:GAF domain-containing sensor histidine kinase n=1 Tax=Agaribacterium haliotis TaxID=2013869 RepID=UPI000BB5694A|nr:GAF domain-containing sensor histidine kinase [Agaribacterium haliotis]